MPVFVTHSYVVQKYAQTYDIILLQACAERDPKIIWATTEL
jgi:hypothetical protein